MNIEARKISLAQMLFSIQKEDLLDEIEALLNKEVVAYNTDGTPLTLKAYNKLIKQGMDDVKHGRVTSTEDLRKEVKTWQK